MKSFHLLIFFLVLNTAFSQIPIEYDALPHPVQRFFPTVYHLPDSVRVQWTVEDSVYVARFTSNGYPVEVRMKANGFWMITLWDIDPLFLPASIIEYCKTMYPGSHILRSQLTNNIFDEQKYILTIEVEQPRKEIIQLHFKITGEPLQQ